MQTSARRHRARALQPARAMQAPHATSLRSRSEASARCPTLPLLATDRDSRQPSGRREKQSAASRASLSDCKADGATHARAAKTAVAVRVLGQVLLVIVLGVVEL